MYQIDMKQIEILRELDAYPINGYIYQLFI